MFTWGRKKTTGAAGPAAVQETADMARVADALSDLYEVMTDIRDEVRGLRDHLETGESVKETGEKIRDGIDKLADGMADDLGAIRERLNIHGDGVPAEWS
jgi:D-alanyl-D-alanine dipeptidase